MSVRLASVHTTERRSRSASVITFSASVRSTEGSRMAIELNEWEIDLLTKLTAKRLGQAKWNSGNDRHDLKRLLDKLEAAQPRTEAATDGN